MKKTIILALAAMMMVGCDFIAMDSLKVTSGTKYAVTSKRKMGLRYLYHLVEVGDTWYDYNYKDTANFNVGDTLVITISTQERRRQELKELVEQLKK